MLLAKEPQRLLRFERLKMRSETLDVAGRPYLLDEGPALGLQLLDLCALARAALSGMEFAEPTQQLLGRLAALLQRLLQLVGGQAGVRDSW